MTSVLLSSSSVRTIRRVRYVTQAAFAACLLMSSVAMPALGYAADDTQTRLRQLEGSVDTLNRAVFKGEKPPVNLTDSGASSGAPTADYQASVESRLSDLESQLRDLTGKVEKQEFENTQLKTKLDKALADMDLRFQDLNKANSVPTKSDAKSDTPLKQSGTLAPNDMGGAIPASESDMVDDSEKPAEIAGKLPDMKDNPNAPAPETSPTVKNLGSMTTAPGGASIPSKSNEDVAGQYEAAFSALKSGNTAVAKKGFESFLNANPTHPLAANATYWLGESYYTSGEYEKAARIFAESYKKYPKGPKVADSLLKMGMSLGQAGKKKEACVTLKQLKKEFTTGGDAVTLRRADQEMSRLACAT